MLKICYLPKMQVNFGLILNFGFGSIFFTMDGLTALYQTSENTGKPVSGMSY
jgi:hypothetical protein